MTVVQENKSPESVQESLQVVQDLLRKHELVESLVHKQQGPKHDLIESLVHKQNLAELRAKIGRASCRERVSVLV